MKSDEDHTKKTTGRRDWRRPIAKMTHMNLPKKPNQYCTDAEQPTTRVIVFTYLPYLLPT